jgi:hypothetical protein
MSFVSSADGMTLGIGCWRQFRRLIVGESLYRFHTVASHEVPKRLVGLPV